MTANEMAVEGYYMVAGIASHKYKQGWKFLTLWDTYGLSEATWEPPRILWGPKIPKPATGKNTTFFVKLYHKELIFRSLPPPPAPKLEIFQPLDRQCRLDSILNRPYARNMTFTT